MWIYRSISSIPSDEAAKLAESGASLEKKFTGVERVKNHSKLFIGISSLDNLVKGGRISRVAGVISSVLNMRVAVMNSENGSYYQSQKAEARRHSVNGSQRLWMN